MDTIDFKDVIYITEDNEIYRKERLVKVIGLPVLVAPIVKIVSKELFILINKNESRENNCWLIDNYGNIEKSFFIDCPLELITTQKYIIASYSDSMMDIGSEFGDAQLVVFDYQGNIVFKYNSDKNKSRIEFLEIKCFLKKDESTILFMSYGKTKSKNDFSIVSFSLIDFSSRELFELSDLKIKNEKLYFTAFIVKHDQWFFLCQQDRYHIVVYSLGPGDNLELYKKIRGVVIKPIIGLINQGVQIKVCTDINMKKSELISINI
ncbi:hypothetical protein [Tenacibaculum sp. 190130A14a]|uniref:hypothetical protein n=1 Tax=Tenacibaculum polynesiense TaxID=3137857 RepID=UPI0032B1E603